MITARNEVGARLCFTCVCDSACWDTPSPADFPRSRPPGSRHPPSRHPTRAVHAGRYGQQVGGTHPTGMHTCYRPQTKFVKVMFLQMSVILFTGGVCLSACWDTSPRSRPPWEQTPPRSRPPPPREQTATAADGTHPTGMHSCCKCGQTVTEMSRTKWHN